MTKILITLILIISPYITYAQQIIEATDQNIESLLELSKEKVLIIDFYATWCGPCKTMDPILEEIADEWQLDVQIIKMDVDNNELDDELNITSIPTYYFIKDSETINIAEGAMSKKEFERYIDSSIYGESVTRTYNPDKNHGKVDEFSTANIETIFDDHDALNRLAWHIFTDHEDLSTISTGLKLVERSIEIEKYYSNVDTYAALLYKSGQHKKALKIAREALLLAEEEGEDSSVTVELIKKIIAKID